MISVIYLLICALLIIKLSWDVIILRRKKRISLGDNNDRELRKAIAAMENASEYMPITLLMLLVLEYNSSPLWLVHLLGSVFILSRVLHAWGVVSRFQWRVTGMKLTFLVMISLIIANLVYLPYDRLPG